MNKFKFRLEKVLSTRRLREEDKQRELATAQREVQAELERQNLISESIDEIIEHMIDQRSESFTALDMQTSWAHRQLLESSIRDQKSVIAEANKVAEIKRTELIVLNKDRRILEKLKEKKLERFNKRKIKKDQKILDELSQYRAGTVFPV